MFTLRGSSAVRVDLCFIVVFKVEKHIHKNPGHKRTAPARSIEEVESLCSFLELLCNESLAELLYLLHPWSTSFARLPVPVCPLLSRSKILVLSKHILIAWLRALAGGCFVVRSYSSRGHAKVAHRGNNGVLALAVRPVEIVLM